MSSQSLIQRRITATGTLGDNGSVIGYSSYSIQVSEQSGKSGATWTINLEGSLDGENYTPIMTHTNSDPGTGQMVVTGAAKFPCRQRRINVIAATFGTGTYLDVRIEGSP